MTLLDFIAALLTGTLAFITAPVPIQNGFLQQLNPIPLTINVTCEYATWFAATAIHEAGHAGLAKYLNNNDAIIHLGKTYTNNANHDPLLEYGPLCLDGFDQLLGTTEFKKHNNVNKTAILLAGGLCGALTHLAMQLARDNHKIQISYGMAYQLMLAVWPIAPGSDGYTIWKEHFNLTDEQLSTAIAMAVPLSIAACITCSAMDKNNSPSAPIHTRLLIGLANYFLSGYAHFSIVED